MASVKSNSKKGTRGSEREDLDDRNAKRRKLDEAADEEFKDVTKPAPETSPINGDDTILSIHHASSSNGMVAHSPSSTSEDDSTAGGVAAIAVEQRTPAPTVSVNGRLFHNDWPAAVGDINLEVHDLPHVSSDTEWWYVNGHAKSTTGRDFSYFASFFRIVIAYDEEQHKYHYAHAVTWAVVDVENKKYYSECLLDPTAPSMIKHQIKNRELAMEPAVLEAMSAIADKGQVPLPDRMLSKSADVALDRLSLDFDNNIFIRDDQGNYTCRCENKAERFAINLKFSPKRKAIRHGHDGVVKIGLKGDDMFYYFIPRCEVSGTVTVDGQPNQVRGSGWYDHEFGGKIRHGPQAKIDMSSAVASPNSPSSSDEKEEQRAKNKMDYAWSWLAVQLDSGMDLTATTVVDPTNHKNHVVLDNFAITIDPDSTRHEYVDDVQFTPLEYWTSVRTLVDYPIKWKLAVPSAQIDLTITAVFPRQECITLIAKPAFWEGRMSVVGTVRGAPVTGLAFVERHGFQTGRSMDQMFKTVSKLVKSEISRVLPLNPTPEQALGLISASGFEHLMDGADIDVYTNTVIKPIREIVDRGGKAWRSYALLLVIDAVGGDSHQFQHCLAMPELMHVGSLIVDDIQDKSETRRGGPSCHKLYGEAIAINAGTAAYFLAVQLLMRALPVSSPDVLKLYDSYFLTLRAGHAGQAFDINGLDHLMPFVVETGNNERLLKAVTCTHRLKSAVPAGNLARMGCVLAHATTEQVNALGNYFESLGVAFQIVDDVLNLRGFEGKGKTRGEDIHAGKITYPVCVAMSSKYLSKEERQMTWNILQEKTTDETKVNKLIDLLESRGALEDSLAGAKQKVEEHWSIVDSLTPPSMYKVNLRAFGRYVLDRHY